MGKQSLFGRVAQLAKANIHGLLDQAEDPQMMLDQMVRDYTANIAEAEDSVAQTIGNLRMLEEDHDRAVNEAQLWGAKALAASRHADDFRSAGNAVDAEKFDNLAKIAIQRQIDAENKANAMAPNITAQREVVDKLKTGLNQMHAKLGELSAKRDALRARQSTVQAQSQMQDAIRSIDAMDSTSALGRYEDRVRRQEAQVQGANELAASSLDAQFAELENLGEQTEVEARLAALKAGNRQKAIEQP